ncbi:hypothetical protein UNPF46_15085 [Bradyrhizobium sp. UNPF46]|uniref:hypothetical protein n=1 Tax=Bradyrhizobium sp. UNPF46 TaxID=1141168 RepID=UPI001151052E|nr:hypothetical protein [Bradyrhizobium sp. UNPF46]TQF38762.1 hypothetical protein UNPF46_15085 [Bradyrhizobium sp. UNPF46]
MDKVIDGFVQVLSFVLASSSTVALLAVGLILLLITSVFAYIAIKSKPEEVTSFFKVAFFVCLVGGLIFSAAGPSLALFYVSQDPIRKKPSNEAIDDLAENKRVRYVIRLISRSPADDALGIDALTQLGPPKQKYSFVADYDELKGYTVKEALDLFGIGLIGGYRVSAVIFPLQVGLYPANARGLLQVVSKVEAGVAPDDRFLKPGKLNQDELREFGDTGIPSYRLDNFKRFYPHYCELAQTFFCGQYAAKDLVGGLYRDWHPLGFSQKNPPAQPCAISTENFCAFSDWGKVRQEFKGHFGVRAFLIENLEIRKIPGRMLFDFQDPLRDRIPELGLGPPSD